jgi:hypothetical protein
MGRTILTLLLAGMMLTFGIMGCAKKAANSQEAIATAQQMKTVDEQVKYLISQSNAFINSKEFDQAIKTAQHILSNLDQNSAEAQSIIEKAKAELQKAAQGAVADVQKKLGSFGQ